MTTYTPPNPFIIASEMRALSHEALAVLAAELACSLLNIVGGRDDSIDCADAALRNSGVPCLIPEIDEATLGF